VFARAVAWQRASLDVECGHPAATQPPPKAVSDEQDNH
jgi:hypothetical protein